MQTYSCLHAFFLMSKTTNQSSWVLSHDLYWENKMYKRKRSIGHGKQREKLLRTIFHSWALSFDIQAAESGLFTKYSTSQISLTDYSSYPINVHDHLPRHKIFNTHNLLLFT